MINFSISRTTDTVRTLRLVQASNYPDNGRADELSVPWGLTHSFLFLNVVAMISCSTLVIIRKYTEYAVFGLIGVVITQALGYGLIFDLNFFLRNLSVMGGLLMVLSDSWVRKKFAPAGLPLPAEKDRKKYIQLAGRILLILLFVGFIWSGDWGIARILVSLFGLVACVMVVVGFKAKWSAILLVVILSVFNLVVNNFWTVRYLLMSEFSIPWAESLPGSCTNITRTRTLPSTISFKYFLLCKCLPNLSI